MPFFTGRNEVGQGNIFTSVCLSTGGEYLPQCMLGYTPPGADLPPEQTPWEQTPRQQTPPGADTPQEQTPPWEQTPPREADSSIRSTSGRYASYWNAFLYLKENWIYVLHLYFLLKFYGVILLSIELKFKKNWAEKKFKSDGSTFPRVSCQSSTPSL